MKTCGKCMNFEQYSRRNGWCKCEERGFGIAHQLVAKTRKACEHFAVQEDKNKNENQVSLDDLCEVK